MGKEGRQASLAADFSVPQFSHIGRLLRACRVIVNAQGNSDGADGLSAALVCAACVQCGTAATAVRGGARRSLRGATMANPCAITIARIWDSTDRQAFGQAEPVCDPPGPHHRDHASRLLRSLLLCTRRAVPGRGCHRMPGNARNVVIHARASTHVRAADVIGTADGWVCSGRQRPRRAHRLKLTYRLARSPTHRVDFGSGTRRCTRWRRSFRSCWTVT